VDAVAALPDSTTQPSRLCELLPQAAGTLHRQDWDARQGLRKGNRLVKTNETIVGSPERPY